MDFEQKNIGFFCIRTYKRIYVNICICGPLISAHAFPLVDELIFYTIKNKLKLPKFCTTKMKNKFTIN